MHGEVGRAHGKGDICKALKVSVNGDRGWVSPGEVHLGLQEAREAFWQRSKLSNLSSVLRRLNPQGPEVKRHFFNRRNLKGCCWKVEMLNNILLTKKEL